MNVIVDQWYLTRSGSFIAHVVKGPSFFEERRPGWPFVVNYYSHDDKENILNTRVVDYDGKINVNDTPFDLILQVDPVNYTSHIATRLLVGHAYKINGYLFHIVCQSDAVNVIGIKFDRFGMPTFQVFGRFTDATHLGKSEKIDSRFMGEFYLPEQDELEI